MQAQPRIGIVGPGKVGSALAVLANRAQMRVEAIVGTTPETAGAAAARLDQDPPPGLDLQALAGCDVVLLTVRDDQIAQACQQVVQAGVLAEQTVLAHCSGAMGSDVLEPAARAGAQTASIHPLQSFPDVQTALDALPGSYVFCEGDSRALLTLEPMLRRMGAIAVRIDPQGKPLYHAAAVMACNYLTGLFDAALDLAVAAGIHRDTAARALGPLAAATVGNLRAEGTVGALTGPIARGDSSTVRRHLQALADQPGDLEALYRAAGRQTLRLARRKAVCDPEALNEIEQLLQDPPSSP